MLNFNEDVFYQLVFSIAMTNLRYTSFALDWISSQNRTRLGAVGDKKDEHNTPGTNSSHGPRINSNVNKSDRESSVLEGKGRQEECSLYDFNERGPTDLASSGQYREITTDISSDRKFKLGVLDTRKMEVKYSLVDMLCYCLYLPYYFTGPITTYGGFYKQVVYIPIPFFDVFSL